MDGCPESFSAIFIRPTPGGNMKEAISLAENSQCPVCFEPITPPVAAPECCNHYFCLPCLSDWSKVQHACPLDRKAYGLIFLHDYIGGPVVERRTPPPIETHIETFVEEDTVCEICHSAGDEAYLLLCDNCDKGYHTYCLTHPLSEIPEGDWFCPVCEPLVREREAAGHEDYANPFADVSAEESEGLGQSSEDSDDFENRPSYLELLSSHSQERFTRAALHRHRGATLLRDLIENLETRALNEQRRRRRVRRSRHNRMEHTLHDFLSAPGLHDRALPLVIPSTSNGVSGLRRKRRRVLRYDSSDSETEERIPRHNNGQSSGDNVAPPPRRKLPRILDHSIASSHSSSPPGNRRHFRSTPLRIGDDTPSRSEFRHKVTLSRNRADDSSRDIFACFATDTSLNSSDDEIHEIGARRTQPSIKPKARKAKTRRRKRRTRKRTRVSDANGLVKRARRTLSKSRTTSKKKKSTRKKRSKGVRSSAPQRSLQKRVPSGSLEPVHLGRTRRGDLKLTSSSKLSVFGDDVTYGLVSDHEDGSTNNKLTTSSERPNVSSTSSTTSLLSRLEAEQNSLFHFSSSNMQINPDHSVSPIPPPKLGIAPALPESKATSAKPPLTRSGVEKALNSEDLEKPSTSSSSPPESSAWTSERVNRVRNLMVEYLRTDHPSSVDQEIRKHLVQRAISKVIRRHPDKVSDARIKKLVDDYVRYFRLKPQH
ncbi:hypothetical protein Aperf_G00000097950 [Anoplocephala perfoliata]